MWKKYGDVAEFFVVYIKEAHAADSSWPMAVPGEEKIYEPTSLDERKAVADKCMTKLKIEMPCLLDDMENTAEKAYSAWPDRLFVVDTDGRIVVSADRGPWGFPPAVKEAKKWLEARFPQVATETRGEESTQGTK